MNIGDQTRGAGKGDPRSTAWSHPVAAVLCLLGLGLAPTQDRGGDQVQEVRDALKQYVETERIISQESRDWTLGKEVLEDRIRLVERELESLRARIEDADKSLGEAGRKKAELLEEDRKLEEASVTIRKTILGLEERTRTLLEHIPGSLRDKVKPISQRIPDPDSEVKIGLGERCSYVIGVLNELDKANKEISVGSEVRVLGDGRTAEVAVLYAGIGQAWYVTGDGRSAGIGTSDGETWTWKRADEIAPAVARAIAIYKNEQAAAFVGLPIRIR